MSGRTELAGSWHEARQQCQVRQSWPAAGMRRGSSVGRTGLLGSWHEARQQCQVGLSWPAAGMRRGSSVR